MRKKLFDIVEPSGTARASAVYDYYMMIVIIMSLVPLVVKEPGPVCELIERVTVAIFILNYLVRLATADYKLGKGVKSFFLYPITPMAIIDLLCILPSFTVLAGGLRLLKVLRLFRTFRVFRAFKAFRYSRSLSVILGVIREQKTPLLAVITLAVGYVLISALVIFQVEPESFGSFFDAVYWATVSLTTVGYGDIYPVSTAGRVITMLSSVFGIAVVALPSGIITAGYLDKLHPEQQRGKIKKRPRKQQTGIPAAARRRILLKSGG